MKEEQKLIPFDSYEEGAVIKALNDLRNKEIEEKHFTDFVDDLLLKILRAPSRKARISGSPKSPGTFWGEEEQRSKADARRQAGVAERSLRRRDEAR